MTQTQPTTPMQYASRAGMILGIYFVLKYFAMMYWIPYMSLSLVYFFATLLVPVVAYRLTRSYRQSVAPTGVFSFARAWSFGTLTFFFASIIVLIPHYIYYTRLLPDQFPLLEGYMNTFFSQQPEIYRTYKDLLGGAEPVEVIRQTMLGTSIAARLFSDVANNVFWGTILSLINAALLSRRA